MSRSTIIFIICLLLATLGILMYIKNPRPYKIAWASVVRGDVENYLPCQDLPFYQQVEKALKEHQDIADKLKGISGVTDLKPELIKCFTVDGSNYFVKGDVLIEYANRQAGKEIKRTIGDNFFGIPYRGDKK